jgi:hypothetical protein
VRAMGRHNIKTAVVLCCGGIALVSRLVWNVLSQPTMSAAYKRTVRLHSIQYKVAFRYRPPQRFRTAGKCCYSVKLSKTGWIRSTGSGFPAKYVGMLSGYKAVFGMGFERVGSESEGCEGREEDQ